MTLGGEPKALESMNEEEIDSMFEHSYAQVMAGQGRPAKDVFADLERNNGGHGKQAI